MCPNSSPFINEIFSVPFMLPQNALSVQTLCEKRYVKFCLTILTINLLLHISPLPRSPYSSSLLSFLSVVYRKRNVFYKISPSQQLRFFLILFVLNQEPRQKNLSDVPQQPHKATLTAFLQVSISHVRWLHDQKPMSCLWDDLEKILWRLSPPMVMQSAFI